MLFTVNSSFFSGITQLLEKKSGKTFLCWFLSAYFPRWKYHSVRPYLNMISMTLITTTRVKTRSPTLFIFPPSSVLLLASPQWNQGPYKIARFPPHKFNIILSNFFCSDIILFKLELPWISCGVNYKMLFFVRSIRWNLRR